MIDATVEDAKSSRQKLTEEEITAHAIFFMLAGHETTANTLSYTSYLLALNPHVQEKLQAEIDSFFEENPVIDNSIICIHVRMYSGIQKPLSSGMANS